MKKSRNDIDDSFIFTPANLIKNLQKLGPWSSYGLASSALQHYFPEEYNDEEYTLPTKEVELCNKLQCDYWRDVIIKYHKEIGYKSRELANTDYVNAY